MLESLNQGSDYWPVSMKQKPCFQNHWKSTHTHLAWSSVSTLLRHPDLNGRAEMSKQPSLHRKCPLWHCSFLDCHIASPFSTTLPLSPSSNLFRLFNVCTINALNLGFYTSIFAVLLIDSKCWVIHKFTHALMSISRFP